MGVKDNVFFEGEPLGHWNGDSVVDLIALLETTVLEEFSGLTFSDEVSSHTSKYDPASEFIAVDKYHAGLRADKTIKPFIGVIPQPAQADPPKIFVNGLLLHRRKSVSPGHRNYILNYSGDIYVTFDLNLMSGEVTWTINEDGDVLSTGSSESLGFALDNAMEVFR